MTKHAINLVEDEPIPADERVIGEENSGKTTALNALMADLRRKTMVQNGEFVLVGPDLKLEKHKGGKTLEIKEIGRFELLHTSSSGQEQRQIFTFLDTPGTLS